ncbi:MAG TPA: aa3-type cytochrome c oxidase subunit IV [Sphingomicrobium sp.]|nr:aa3-type cytochrome c oxidase subunit IV [Sphingomicrobium sp.]
MAVNSADHEPVAQDMQAHRRDYAGFTKLFTYGAIAAFLIGMAVLFIIA